MKQTDGMYYIHHGQMRSIWTESARIDVHSMLMPLVMLVNNAASCIICATAAMLCCCCCCCRTFDDNRDSHVFAHFWCITSSFKRVHFSIIIQTINKPLVFIWSKRNESHAMILKFWLDN